MFTIVVLEPDRGDDLLSAPLVDALPVGAAVQLDCVVFEAKCTHKYNALCLEVA